VASEVLAAMPDNSAVKTYLWTWQGKSIEISYQVRGVGSPILLLPAFSTVSSRLEMAPLADLLATNFQTIAIDWPGFGDRSRPRLDYAPPLYRQFLTDFIRDICPQPLTIVAAGHAAGYAIQQAAQQPQTVSHLILVAPTWRGPLPTMMKGNRPWLASIKHLIYTPIVGQFLYWLNSTDGFLKFMYGRHVYSDRTKLTTDFITGKRQLTRQPGARYGAAAFVTGGLDPYEQRDKATSDLGDISQPVLLILGEDSPPKSLAEMQALAALPNVVSQTLPGTLGLHEEYPLELDRAIRSWFS
jgi:pimeloyl-ACP methyl ester carboxylesterase